MNKTYAVVGMLVNHRKKAVPVVQHVLTNFGDQIIGRMGHPKGYGENKEDGLITLTMHATDTEIAEFTHQLDSIDGVVVNVATIAQP